jgi:hypothetical protein
LLAYIKSVAEWVCQICRHWLFAAINFGATFKPTRPRSKVITE